MRIIAAKAETTAGTAIAIGDADTLFYGYEGAITNNVSFTPMTSAGSMSQRPAQPGEESGQHTFTTEFYKSAPWAAILMPALGFVATGSAWSPSDDPTDWEWLTSAQNEGGKLKKIAGAMASAVFTFAAGKVPTVAWTLTGRYEAEADATQWTPAFTIANQHAGIRMGSATTTLGGAAIGLATATLTINNEVALLMNVDKAGGIEKAWIGARSMELVIDPLEELVATRNDDGIQRAKTLQAFSMAWGDMLVSMPKCQVRQIANGERNGLSARALSLVGTMDTAAGDELVIDFDTSA
jgi:hypothetical protein